MRERKREEKTITHFFPMINTIIWNIRGVNSKGAFDRLIRLARTHKTSFISFQEPFVNSSRLHYFRRKIGFNNATSNCSGKIWCLWDDNYSCTIVEDHIQHLTLQVHHIMSQVKFHVSIVYAKIKASNRKDLWGSLSQLNQQIVGPWSIMGNFNVIMESSEKKGGRRHRLSRSLDFINCMVDCGMKDAGYVGNDYTWCNGRRKMKRILKRLDRVMYNDKWFEEFSNVTARHLPRTGADHNTMLLKCTLSNTPMVKYFKFLNFWSSQPDFMEVVQNSWDEYTEGNAMYIMQQKLKKLAHCLSSWSKNTIGNVFDRVMDMENNIKHAEAAYDQDNTDSNRTNLHALYAEQIR
ncbi:uncharacterized protein LOC132039071 [Lycium ferocissimum]|uniref:uncharacterized protein LOC132039071 n=1 Tax=Lycium ferocissimum TaxID=112874 RepID=UPI002815F296|nr:uncharacterized protein LOC132039071 [Lycium ferocissimum]